MAKLVNAHKRMAMGSKKSELYDRAYKKGGSVECPCPEDGHKMKMKHGGKPKK